MSLYGAASIGHLTPPSRLAEFSRSMLQSDFYCFVSVAVSTVEWNNTFTVALLSSERSNSEILGSTNLASSGCFHQQPSMTRGKFKLFWLWSLIRNFFSPTVYRKNLFNDIIETLRSYSLDISRNVPSSIVSRRVYNVRNISKCFSHSPNILKYCSHAPIDDEENWRHVIFSRLGSSKEIPGRLKFGGCENDLRYSSYPSSKASCII